MPRLFLRHENKGGRHVSYIYIILVICLIYLISVMDEVTVGPVFDLIKDMKSSRGT